MGLPRGTVTFVFTDLERSTRRWEAHPDLIAGDVRRVLEAAGGGPAHVFGSSGGAITGLALVTRHPGHVHTLVAHEPPLALLLPETGAPAAFQDIYDTYRTSGTDAAWQKFITFLTSFFNVRLQGEDAAAAAAAAEMVIGGRAAAERMFGHTTPLALYQPDFAALRAAPTRVVIAGGTTSKGGFEQRAAAALAGRLGIPLIDFPRRPRRARGAARGLRRRPPPHPRIGHWARRAGAESGL
jgi:pimeloyl-ACP methyl ester carboxylesterase